MGEDEFGFVLPRLRLQEETGMRDHRSVPDGAVSMGARATGPLVGFRILDVTHYAAGPFAGLMLADLGADVIKIEAPGGDFARNVGPFHPEDTERAYGGRYAQRNRNKRSICLDLTTAEDQSTFLELVETADGLIENMRHGVLDRLGVGWEACQARNPRLVYAAIRGFGDPRTGASPYVEWPALDPIAQAMGGFVANTGPDEAHPMRGGPIVGDLVPGLQATIGLLAALLHAQRSGVGQFLDVAMVDGVMSICESAHTMWVYEGQRFERAGNSLLAVAPVDLYPTVDGAVSLVAANDRQWRHLARAMDRPDLEEDPALAHLAGRNAARAAVDLVVRQWCAARTTNQVLQALGGLVPVGPVYGAPDWADEPHVVARGMLVRVEHRNHPATTQLACPIKLTETPANVYRSPPLLDEHGAEIRAELTARRTRL